MSLSGLLGTFFAASIIILFLGLIITVGLYILSSLAYCKALRMMKYENSWAGWVPGYRLYAFADLIKNDDGTTTVLKQKVPYMLFNFWWLIAFAVSYVPYIGSLLVIALNVICLGTCFIRIYSVLENRPEEEVTVIGYLSGWIPLIAIIKFLTYSEVTYIS